MCFLIFFIQIQTRLLSCFFYKHEMKNESTAWQMISLEQLAALPVYVPVNFVY